jgi:hypothetical protein
MRTIDASNSIPASRQLLNITKGALDDCEKECARLLALNAELVAALTEISQMKTEDLAIADGHQYDNLAAWAAAAAVAKAKGL